jgi:hypothetical protein
LCRPFALEGVTLHPTLTEYLDGVRQCLEVEVEKDAPAAREQRLTFADFVTELVKSFPRECNTISTPAIKNIVTDFAIFLSAIANYRIPIEEG